jgi:hypothetical protein
MLTSCHRNFLSLFVCLGILTISNGDVFISLSTASHHFIKSDFEQIGFGILLLAHLFYLFSNGDVIKTLGGRNWHDWSFRQNKTIIEKRLFLG